MQAAGRGGTSRKLQLHISRLVWRIGFTAYTMQVEKVSGVSSNSEKGTRCDFFVTCLGQAIVSQQSQTNMRFGCSFLKWLSNDCVIGYNMQ